MAKDAKSRRTANLATPNDLGANATKDVAGGLNILLADVIALYFKTKNFHWHVSGPHFRDYHLLLDEQATQIYAMTDVIAERVRKLGGNDHPLGRPRSSACSACSTTTPTTSRRTTCWPSCATTTSSSLKHMRIAPRGLRRARRHRHRQPDRELGRRDRAAHVVPVRDAAAAPRARTLTALTQLARDHRRHEMLQRRRAELLHGGARLLLQQVEHALDARLAEGAEPPEIGPADADGARAERQRLDDVGAAAEARIDQHRDAAVDRLDDLGQRVDGRAAAVLGAAAMVRDDDGVEPVVDGEDGVLGASSGPSARSLVFTVSRRRLMNVPGEVGGAGAVDAGEVDARRSWACACTKLARPSAWHDAQLRVSVRHSRHEGLPVLPGQHVDRDDDGSGAGLLGAPGQRLGDLPFVGRVELEPDRPAARLDRLLDRGRRHGREHLQVVAALRAARATASSPSSWKARLRAGRRHHDRAAVGRAEQLHA